MTEEREEYATRYSDGSMNVWNRDAAVEGIYPVAERIGHEIRMGHHVYRRTVIVVEDWTRVRRPR